MVSSTAELTTDLSQVRVAMTSSRVAGTSVVWASTPASDSAVKASVHC